MAKTFAKPLKIARLYVKDLKKNLKVKRAIVFGSVARGEMTEDSDIDLIIISPDFKKMDFVKRFTFLSHLREGITRKVPMDIFGYTSEEFKKLSKESVALGEAAKEGIVIK